MRLIAVCRGVNRAGRWDPLTDWRVSHFLCRCPGDAGEHASPAHVLARGMFVPACFTPRPSRRQFLPFTPLSRGPRQLSEGAKTPPRTRQLSRLCGVDAPLPAPVAAGHCISGDTLRCHCSAPGWCPPLQQSWTNREHRNQPPWFNEQFRFCCWVLWHTRPAR